MSTNWFKDMQDMHKKYGVDTWMDAEKNSDWSRLQMFMDFRVKMMQEELDETKAAVKNGDAEEIVDGIIDMCVFAIGTLEVFGVDANKAWDQVLKANMSKEVGIKEGRPNPLGLPDLIKPEGWEGPTHKGNHGNITDSF
tara:strand:- start:529 stop:945 length:417 start_codon:yes stop_codon:yes gene_type:complete